ncbi:hypothetical protein S40285_03796 [Stachybotrys chlorohalonatus IBT 40285]|uniref:Voltage-gated hydrogen channel 1 n=1 Tax=Stachybotrys chlorohalonatus (strain IBT 40285) TaxID=1283841 RepID=A0A084QFP9_STAC4|nr:hypothetical protein S40285_03796 [Stachybotrys chlorohalonata IBT 40285]
MASIDDISRPLLPDTHHETGDGDASSGHSHKPWKGKATVQSYRAYGRRLLSSRGKHFGTMAIVAFDVAALLANVFIELISCEMDQRDEPWVRKLIAALQIVGLVFSCVFLAELVACLFAFGFNYLSSWFQVFDSAVIVASFTIDVASQGLTESIGSLVVVLRLWRLAKISEEVILGAVERVDSLEHRMEELEQENRELRAELGFGSHEHALHE